MLLALCDIGDAATRISFQTVAGTGPDTGIIADLKRRRRSTFSRIAGRRRICSLAFIISAITKIRAGLIARNRLSVAAPADIISSRRCLPSVQAASAAMVRTILAVQV